MISLNALCLALLLALALGAGFAPDAEAARLGGGRSVGAARALVQRQALPRPRQDVPIAQAPGSLGGLAGGLGLGWLLAQGGMGPMLLGLLVVAAAIALIMWMNRNEPAPAMRAGDAALHYAGLGNETVAAPPPSQLPAEGNWSAAAEPAMAPIPRGFDTAAFLKEAKRQFIRLQEANDQADLQTLRDLTTVALHETLAEDIRRSGNGQRTEVVTLEAAMLEVTTSGAEHRAGVRFSGLICEAAGSRPVPFAEIWHLVKPVSGTSGWMVAGIEQLPRHSSR